MSKNKSTISQSHSPQQIGEYWDNHDLGEVWEQTEPVAFEMEAGGEAIYFPVETRLSQELRSLARQHGVSAETLLNLWLQERVAQETASN